MPKDVEYKELLKNIPHKMKNPPDIKELKGDLTSAQVFHKTEMNKIEEWRRLRKPKKLRSKSKSTYQSRLVRTQAEWSHAELSEPLLSTPNIFNINPKTKSEIKKAWQNHLIINNQFNNVLNRQYIIDKLIHILVRDGVVVLRSGWETLHTIEVEEEDTYAFEQIPVDHPNAVMYERIFQAEQQTGNLPNIEPELLAGYLFSKKSGVPHIAIKNGIKEKFVKKQTKNGPVVDVMDYDKVIIDPDAKGNRDLAKFVIFEFQISKSDMKSQEGKYFNIDMIKDAPRNTSGDISEIEETITTFDYSDASAYPHTAYEYWGYADINKTGIAVPFVATWIDNILVRLEKHPVPEMGLPFSLIQYMPEFDQNAGEADAELIGSDQKVLSAFNRGIIDIMAKSAAGQKGYREGSLDYINKRKFEAGKNFAFKGNVPDPRQIFHVFNFPEIPSSINWIINHHTKNAENLSGTQPYGSNGVGNSETAIGVRNMMDSTAKRRMSIIRRIMQGLKEIGTQILYLNHNFLNEEEIVRVTDSEFITINREDLVGEFDISIEINTAEQNEIQAKELAFMLQTDTKSDPEYRRMIQAKIAKLRGLDDLADEIKSFQPQPDPIQQQLQQLQVQLLQAQIQNELAKARENNANGMFDEARVNTEAAKAMKLKAEAEMLDLDFVEQSTGVHQERDKELAVLNHLSKEQIEKAKMKMKTQGNQNG